MCNCRPVWSESLTVQVVVEWVEVPACVLLVVPIKVELELLTRLHNLLLLTVTTLTGDSTRQGCVGAGAGVWVLVRVCECRCGWEATQ